MCFLFVLMQSSLLIIIITFSTSPAVLFCKQKLLNHLLITHDHPLHKHCISSDPFTLPQGQINWCQTWLGNTQGVRFSQLALCNRDRLLTFSHAVYPPVLGGLPDLIVGIFNRNVIWIWNLNTPWYFELLDNYCLFFIFLYSSETFQFFPFLHKSYICFEKKTL